jgi:hypothetical protein
MRIVLTYLKLHPEVIDELINKFDDIAHDSDPVHGQLPCDDWSREKMRKAVKDWIGKLLG